jgi:chemotaxis protein methyltransferase CheR
LDAAVLDRLTTLVARACGIHVRASTRWLLGARVEARMAAQGARDARAYLDLVEGPGGDAELGALVEAIRVGETRFFRHGAQLQALRRVVIPELGARASASGRAVRAWSAGCSTGEEPYTLAMLLDDAMPRARGLQVSVLATDISEAALAIAQAGRYEADAVSPVPEDLRARYFEHDGDGFRVSPSLRALVRFERRNLVDPGYPRGFDLILCRNVLIYFGPGGRDEVVRRLAASLAPGGFLFLGYSETLHAFDDQFEAISTEEGILYRSRSSAAPLPVTPTPRPGAPDPPASAADVPPAEPCRVVLAGSYEDRRLAAELAPVLAGRAATVTVDLDGADFLGDEAARDLRRAKALLAEQGRSLVVIARRPGVLRWIDRVGLAEDVTVVRRSEAGS